jgi:hypothetical protein
MRRASGKPPIEFKVAAPPPPEPERAACGITLAFLGGGASLAKLVFNGVVTTPPFPLVYNFVHIEVGNLDELLPVIERGAELGAVALRGAPIAASGRRALKDDAAKGPAGLTAPPRRHAALDWDSLMIEGVDPLDGPACASAILPYLPPELRCASLIWQLTAGAGVKPGVRIRTWHWLGRPLSSEELKAWLAPLHKGEDAVLDPATLLPCQPIFLGVTGGPQVQRFGILRGERDTAAPPQIVLPPPREVDRRPPPPPRRVPKRYGRPLRLGGGRHMARLIRECITEIRGYRSEVGQRLEVFRHQGARALALAALGGVSREQVEEMLRRAGAYVFENDPDHVQRNVEGLIEWWRARQEGGQ